MLAKTLGELEQLVMEIVWRNKESAVRDVFQELRKKRSIAYTTVATVLQRLFNKDIVGRKAEKNGYRYFPKVSKESYAKSLTKSFVKKLEKSFGDVAISSFAEGIESLPKDKKNYLLKILSEYESKH
ncbi:conserved hypothetical protein [Candidatus Roizmanbacteria bacterium]|nr:conserved hypothetical protein [Candidatus Roizmanbacteria bacterium]